MTAAIEASTNQTLYVDLDGTLVATDTMWESLCLLARRHPGRLLHLPAWLARGKAGFKAELARWVRPDPSCLPYRPEIIDLIERERDRGRRVVLATASHESVARPIAEELGLFDDVIASSEESNLRSAAKLSAIREDSGGAPFGYLGDSRADLPVWQGSDWSIVAHPSPGLQRAITRAGIAAEIVARAQPTRSARAMWKAVRPHQWAKNLLLFAPIILAQKFIDLERSLAVLVGFMAFSAIASFGYLVNDLLDIEADRLDSEKSRRPFAAGVLSIPAGLALATGLLVAGLGLSYAFVSLAFSLMIAAYLVATLSYSFYLKELLFLDVLVLAGLYTHRVLSGGVAANVPVSTWLLAFSVFFFLSLALVKRYTELLRRSARGDRSGADSVSRRAYQVRDTELLAMMGISSGFLSVLVLGLYVSSDDVTRYYSNPEILWLVTPLMLYWISRIWLLARRGELSSDPVLFAATDRISYGIVGGIALIGGLAAVWGKVL